MHAARTSGELIHDPQRGTHWSAGDDATTHPGRLADCALCLLAGGLEAEA